MPHSWVDFFPPLRRFGCRGGTFFLLLFLVLLPAQAAEPPLHSSPKTVVLLTPPGASVDDLRWGGPLQEVRTQFCAGGSVALLNPAVAGEPTDAAAYLSLGAGEPLRAPNHNGPVLEEGGVGQTMADLATEAYTVGSHEGTPTRDAYTRRFGVPLTQNAAVTHLGVPALLSAQANPRQAAQIGALGTALRRAGKRVAVYGGWPAALVGMDKNGVVPVGSIYRPLPPSKLIGLLGAADVIFIAVPNKSDLKFMARALLPFARHGAVDVLIVAAAPVHATSTGGAWARLGWIACAGPHFAPQTVLSSPTTRTPGLIANVDVAPTILALQNAGTLPGGTGRAAFSLPARSVWGTLTLLDRQATAGAKANLPVMATYAVLAIGSCLLALLTLYRNSAVLSRVARFGLLTSAAVLLTLLPAGWIAPPSVSVYAADVFISACVVAVLAAGIGRLFFLSPIALIFGILTVVVAVDTLLGGPITQRAVNNFLPGIRYYGIGNEYMGVLLGAALTGMALLPLPRIALPLFGSATVLLLGLPMCGADAGGALAATVAFVVAVYARRGSLHLRHLAVTFVAAFAVVAALTLLDSTRGEASRSHVGEAIVTAKRAGGVTPLLEIAARKVAMNVAIFLHPLTLTALAVLTPLYLLLSRGTMGTRAKATLLARPALARALPALLWGAFASLVFNDSGVVAALLLLACPTATLLLLLLDDAEKNRLTAAQNAQAG